MGCLDVAEVLGFSPARAAELCASVGLETCPACQTALSLARLATASPSCLPSGLASLDVALRGGLSFGLLTEGAARHQTPVIPPRWS